MCIRECVFRVCIYTRAGVQVYYGTCSLCFFICEEEKFAETQILCVQSAHVRSLPETNDPSPGLRPCG